MDIDPKTRDDQTVIKICEALSSFPVTDDDQLSDALYEEARAYPDTGETWTDIERSKFTRLAEDSGVGPFVTSVFTWFDDLNATVRVEVGRSLSSDIKIVSELPARDNRQPPIHITLEFNQDESPALSVYGHRTPGTESTLWTGQPSDVDPDEVLANAADDVMPSVVSRVAELSNECGFTDRRADALALTELGWTDEDIRDALNVDDESTIRSYRSKASGGTRDAERRFITRIGTPKSILGSSEVTAGGRFPRRYYVCEAIGEDDTTFLVTVEDKDSGPSANTLEYNDLDALVEAHKDEAEFLGWEGAIHEAQSTSTSD